MRSACSCAAFLASSVCLACAAGAPSPAVAPLPDLPLPTLSVSWDSGGTGAVLGTVTDERNVAMPQARVSLQLDRGGHPSQLIGELAVDSGGRFARGRLRPATYVVWSDAHGQWPCMFELKLRPHTAYALRIRLKPLPPPDAKKMIFPKATEYCVKP